ncbi:MAG: TetR/AcrR family transcriptional regulator, transcriptional repressor for nem operon [Methanolobus sp.]|jgi:TetR/AcrR family transcriptional repressor of nem operon|uniref:TetR/AcrR family transcriptional regulator n=1 Tax=Methanolobus bombayensis TaxID=38023 RepID=UPI001AE864CB|nr:TetR/AcrR family transcriptional regulator [Methanolobus bombayensis]MBP1909224.1 TetR/AcrR family transcriptional repressor of nem operon [Methanolobus bombayensis]MDK2947100.1 TetR/AcrR family transcriptional regulator, transcriptional repressor for nem operon [Methanolobus sp.]
MTDLNPTNQQILHYARLFLQCGGYNGFSYKDISQKLGIKNASIHHYYPKKEDLVAALLEERRKHLSMSITQMVESKKSAREQLQYYFDYALQEFDEGKCICPPGSVVIDFKELPEKVQKQDMLLFDEILEWLNNVLRIGLEQGEFDFSDSVETQAEMVVETLMGARLLSSIKGRKTLVRAISSIKSCLGWRD